MKDDDNFFLHSLAHKPHHGSGAYTQLHQATGEGRGSRGSKGKADTGEEGLHDLGARFRAERAARLLRDKVHRTSKQPMLEDRSVYGAVILIPQLARSCNWTWELMLLTFKVYVFLLINFVIQFMLLSAIEREESIMDLFSGQMYLCDFGAPINGCPDDPSCQGPGGSQIEASRLYSYHAWQLRNFVKQSLMAVFPDQSQSIDEKIDPGEYGAESISVRWLCSFIFMMSVMNELELVLNMIRFLSNIPTKADLWIDCNEAYESVVDGPRECDHEDDELVVKVAGMPWLWKAINCIFVLLPKALLWRLTAEAGITFLMETSTISEMIVNAVALSFILQIDEIICANLMSDSIQDLLRVCQGPGLDAPRPSGINQDIGSAKKWHAFFSEVLSMIPARLITSVTLTVGFVYWYYFTHCNWNPDGGWWSSKPMYLPKTTDFTLFNILLPAYFPVPRESKPFWRMPEAN